MQFTGAGTTCALSGESRFIYIIMYCAEPGQGSAKDRGTMKKGQKKQKPAGSEVRATRRLRRWERWMRLEMRERTWMNTLWVARRKCVHLALSTLWQNEVPKKFRGQGLQSRFKTSAIYKKNTGVFLMCLSVPHMIWTNALAAVQISLSLVPDACDYYFFTLCRCCWAGTSFFFVQVT